MRRIDEVAVDVLADLELARPGRIEEQVELVERLVVQRLAVERRVPSGLQVLEQRREPRLEEEADVLGLDGQVRRLALPQDREDSRERRRERVAAGTGASELAA